MQQVDSAGGIGGETPREVLELDYKGLAAAAYAAGWAVLANHADAEDIAAAALTIFVLQAELPDTPRAWVTTVAKRLAINLKKRLSREVPLDEHYDRAAQRDTVDELAMQMLIEERLRKLSPRQQQAIRERYLLDKNVAGVAAALGISIEAAKTHLHRARRQLRILLAEVGEG